MKIKSKILIICFALVSTLLLVSGCHTAHGFGQDVSAGGQEIQEAAS